MGKLPVTLQTTVVGALGGLLGALLSEVLVGSSGGETALQAIVSTGVWTALVMLPLTLLLVAAENVLGLRGRWWRDLGRVWLPALLLGALSGAFAQLAYGIVTSASDEFERLFRGLGWGLMGIGVGLVLGLADRSWQKAGRGALGGLVGGTIGGLVFDSFLGLRLGENDTGTFARLVGLTVLGAAIGFMLRLSQELFKSAWLLGTTTGPYEGKQYVLSKNTVTVGRSDAQDISLYHDRDVPLKAGQLVRRGREWVWQGEAVEINGERVTGGPVRGGDRLRLGNTVFVFQEKGQTPGSAAQELHERLLLHGDAQVIELPVPLSRVTLGSQGPQAVQGADVLPRHAELRVQGGELTLKALGPLSVNEQPMAPGQSRPLRAGDLLELGGVSLALLRAGG
ncbi:FHA domain-containing protein [Deinococcus sp. NW-56]|uniref:FHA domain-containing protein n=1 Tax=Deinococcus sp. NW-56 TaxID=2080419 RepID=UPI000CF4DE0B|nr:FHA domain-containing protein [Deinococcus sp. NW-56]